MAIGRFLAGDQIMLHGYLETDDKDGRLFMQLYPGLTVNFDISNILGQESIEDPITKARFLRVTLNRNTEITAVFQPQLARIAFGTGMPFRPGAMTGSGDPEPYYW